MKYLLPLLVVLLFTASAQRYYEYQNPAMGFAIAYPTTWQATENADRTGVMLVDLKVKVKDRPSFVVSAGRVPAGVKLDDYERLIPRLFAFLLDDYKQYLKQPTTLGGAPARMLLFEAKAGGVAVVGFVSYAIHNEAVYTAMFFSNRNTYDQYRQVGGNILGSFRFLVR
jgi:hypothetical protein